MSQQGTKKDPQQGSTTTKVVICGGGIIGCSIAYYLSKLAEEHKREDLDITVVEQSSVGCAASGKAGGFLALDWCNGLDYEALARKGFEMHSSLPEELGVDVDYRVVNTYSTSVGPTIKKSKLTSTQSDKEHVWLAPNATISGQIGTTENTAQVHPLKLTRAFHLRASERGVKTLSGSVERVEIDTDSSTGARSVRSVIVSGKEIDADVVIVALGPWSAPACDWLSLPRTSYVLYFLVCFLCVCLSCLRFWRALLLINSSVSTFPLTHLLPTFF